MTSVNDSPRAFNPASAAYASSDIVRVLWAILIGRERVYVYLSSRPVRAYSTHFACSRESLGNGGSCAAYTARANAHKQSSCAPVGCLNFNVPDFVGSHCCAVICTRRVELSLGSVSLCCSMLSFSLPKMSPFTGAVRVMPFIAGMNSLICSYGPSPTPVWSKYPALNQ